MESGSYTPGYDLGQDRAPCMMTEDGFEVFPRDKHG